MKVFVFLCLLAVAAADFEVAKIDPCEPPNPDAPKLCDIHEVRINPCRKGKHCIFKKGQDAAMNFDFTPNFSATALKMKAYWASTSGDVPFDGLGGDDGCAYTPCPIEPGKKQSFNYDLHIGKKLPSGIFAFKWKVWNQENEEQVCCFKTTVQLKKSSK